MLNQGPFELSDAEVDAQMQEMQCCIFSTVTIFACGFALFKSCNSGRPFTDELADVCRTIRPSDDYNHGYFDGYNQSNNQAAQRDTFRQMTKLFRRRS